MTLRLQFGLLCVVSLAYTAPPALPFFDWKACPFEGCSYRAWTVTRPVIVYSTYRRDRRPIDRLRKGDGVIGIRGVVITYRPGIIIMERDFPDYKLKRGERILTYAYRGEGFSAVWVHGRYDPEFDISFARWPSGWGCGGTHCAALYRDMGKKTWWALVKLKSGRTGWVNMNRGGFDGVDMLA